MIRSRVASGEADSSSDFVPHADEYVLSSLEDLEIAVEPLGFNYNFLDVDYNGPRLWAAPTSAKSYRAADDLLQHTGAQTDKAILIARYRNMTEALSLGLVFVQSRTSRLSVEHFTPLLKALHVHKKQGGQVFNNEQDQAGQDQSTKGDPRERSSPITGEVKDADIDRASTSKRQRARIYSPAITSHIKLRSIRNRGRKANVNSRDCRLTDKSLAAINVWGYQRPTTVQESVPNETLKNKSDSLN